MYLISIDPGGTTGVVVFRFVQGHKDCIRNAQSLKVTNAQSITQTGIAYNLSTLLQRYTPAIVLYEESPPGSSHEQRAYQRVIDVIRNWVSPDDIRTMRPAEWKGVPVDPMLTPVFRLDRKYTRHEKDAFNMGVRFACDQYTIKEIRD